MAWKTEYESLTDAPLQEYIDPRVIPIFLRIDIKSLDVDALKGFGIEIISQEDDGLIIGASLDAFEKLKLKIDRFDKGLDKGTAYLWEIDNGVAWKRDFILSPELNAKLDRLPDNEVLELDFSIACNISLGLKPIIKDGETARKYQVRLDRWEQKARARDDIQIARYNQFEAIINIYGTIRSMFDYYDSFGIRAEITAKGLKDILFNYPYVFEIVEHDYLEGIFEEAPESRDFNVQIIAPSVTAPKVCVIDSGIMEGHRLLAPAIDTANSKSYVNGEGPADLVEGGGHGTRVAGAILYPSGISGNGNVQLPCWIQNAKVLNQRTLLPNSLFPPQLMRQIVHDYLPTKIYNLSITSFTPCRLNHMSLWAASIDKLTWEHDIIFVIAVGNLLKRGINAKPGIVDFLNKGLNYPDYLLSESFCRIANPSQSSFSLSVGSVTIGEFEDDYRISFAKSSGLGVGPSPFSRTGLGLWGMIKPDVVEFGGDLVREKQQNPNIIEHADTSPHLVKSIRTSNDATGKDRVGTSFAAPKVSHIVASLQENFSTQNSLFYRGLVIHSARLPDYAFNNPNVDYLRHFGYGIPNLNRALDNTQKRITLYTNGLINAKHADIYSLIIPREINNPGADFDVLVELTLSYKAEPRRTRMRTNSYLSHWLDWKTSKVGETFAEFQTRIINAPNDENDEFEEDELDPFVQAKPELPWKIRERTNLGDIRDIKRQDNTAQKDWMIVKSYQLSEIIGIAIMGHKGWSVDLEDTIPYCLFVSFEILTPEINVNIYEEIRLANRIEIPVEVRV
ncbi:MAG: S8 family peptidase [Ferruginibacter sp.]|nr:S8 family peptidase [Ferruginibacter sp.]